MILLLTLLSILTETAFASQQTEMLSEPALDGANNKTTSEHKALSTAKGLIMLDYEVIPVPGNESLDLLGVRYLHQLNSWLYLGIGLHAPLLHGNYGGFMAADASIHAQRKIFGNLFADVGAALGGGGGGSSISHSKVLSGNGGFIKSYAGLGYDFDSFSAGVNYTHFRFIKGQIKHSQLNLFIQKPVSYSIGSYANSGKKIESDSTSLESGENILTLELNNIFQIKPQGRVKSTINTVSLQFSHFLTENQYIFVGLDGGYNGLALYNHVLGGMGYKFSISPRVNFYSQIGVGSGGYAPSVIETGSGLLVYPKFSLEYLLRSNLGLSLSSGYLFAPKGSSKNFTLGAAMNYHLSAEENDATGSTAKGLIFRGFRVTEFHQTAFKVQVGEKKHKNINMFSTQFDYILNDNWYLPIQVSAAYNDFLGYPGYGELLTGLGIQNKFSSKDRFQGFFQILIGANVNGIVIKPAIGLNYSLSDHYAIYGQLGKTIALNKDARAPVNIQLNAYNIGLGLTYRFSLPDTLLN